MKPIIILGLTAAFLGGVAVALLVSYSIPANTHLVAFWAVMVALGACLLGGAAVALHAARAERLTAERMIDLTVDRMLRRRGLEVVDD